jgi:hypothetical protein
MNARRFRSFAVAAFAVVALGATLNCATNCDRVQSWSQRGSATCRTCQSERCQTQGAALLGAFLTAPCQAEGACVNDNHCWHGAVGDLNNLDCGCAYNCLRTASCRQYVDDAFACLVAQCDAICR